MNEILKKLPLKKMKCSFLVSPFFFLIPFSGYAQEKIKTEEVDIVKAYQPLLADAVKIQLHAEPASLDTSMKPLQYDVKSHLIEVPFVPAEIKPIALPEEKQEPLQNNLIKAGFGTQLSPLIELYLANGRSEKFTYGLQAHYLSANGTKNDYQDMSQLDGKLFGTSYFKNTALSGEFSYDKDNYNLYGFDPSYLDTTDFESSSFLKQKFQTVAGGAEFLNTKATQADIDYRFRFRFHSMKKLEESDSFPGETENYFTFGTELNKEIQKVHNVNLGFDFQQENFKSENDTSINYFSIVPAYHYKGKLLEVKLGLNADVVDEDVQLFPLIEASYRLVDDYLIPYAGYSGGRNPHTMQEIIHVNPFIPVFSPATSQVQEVYGGIRGTYANNISYNFKLGYSEQLNVPFYVPAGNAPVYYTVEYYEKAKIIGFHGEIGYRQSERLMLLLSGDANSWDLDFDDEPLGIPKSKLSLAATYNIQEKIIFNVDLFTQGGAYTVIPGDSVQTQLKGFADLNFSTTYNYKPNISFWLAFNNITGVKQREWYNYPSYGFRAMGGVMLRF